MLTCTCGVVDTEPVVLSHLLAFEAAEEKLLFRHGCTNALPRASTDLDLAAGD